MMAAAKIGDAMFVNHNLFRDHHNVLVGMQTKKLSSGSADEHQDVRNSTHLILRQSAVVPTREFKLTRTSRWRADMSVPAAWCLIASRLATHSEEGASTTME